MWPSLLAVRRSPVVEATRAKLVIPIHWDNFFKPLDEPLEPSPPPFDLVDRAMRA
jgi:L-ascorbate metabolism protein UlaG (beta-lactamase superfamily)